MGGLGDSIRERGLRGVELGGRVTLGEAWCVVLLGLGGDVVVRDDPFRRVISK